MYTHEFRVRMHHTDAAGVAFFAQFFVMAHEAYEAALEAHGAPLGEWLRESPAPLVHSEADYLRPLRLSDRARVLVGVERLGSRSFTLAYRIEALVEEEWRPAARLKLVHVAVEAGIGASVTLPSRVREVLAAIGPLDDPRGEP